MTLGTPSLKAPEDLLAGTPHASEKLRTVHEITITTFSSRRRRADAGPPQPPGRTGCRAGRFFFLAPRAPAFVDGRALACQLAISRPPSAAPGSSSPPPGTFGRRSRSLSSRSFADKGVSAGGGRRQARAPRRGLAAAAACFLSCSAFGDVRRAAGPRLWRPGSRRAEAAIRASAAAAPPAATARRAAGRPDRRKLDSRRRLFGGLTDSPSAGFFAAAGFSGSCPEDLHFAGMLPPGDT